MQWLTAQFNTLIIHPLITITICLMLGIWFATGTSNMPMIGMLLLSCAAVHWYSNDSSRRAFLLFLVSCTSFCMGIGLATYQRHAHTALATTLHTGPYDVIARVTDIQATDKAHYPYTIFFELSKYKKSSHASSFSSHNASIAIYCNKLPDVQIDDVLYLEECKFSEHKPKTGFHDYLIKSSIHGTVFCHQLKYTLLARPPFSLQRSISNLRTRIFDHVTSKMSEQTAAFYASLFLGNCQTHKMYLKNIKTDFGIWGLSHFLARSGLHLVLFIFLLNMLLSYVPIRSRYKYLIMLILNTIYLLLSWSSVSFLRSFAALCLYYIAHLLQQQPSTLHSITLLTCVFLLCNPMLLFFLDFQLSFGLTFALAWIYQAYAWQKHGVA